MENCIIFVEGNRHRALNRFMERHQEKIKNFLTFNGVNIKKFSIIKPSDEGERTVRNLILRKCPTLNEEQLQEKISSAAAESQNSRLLFIARTWQYGEYGCEAYIICEDEWNAKRGYLMQLALFARELIEIGKERERQRLLHIGGDRYKTPEKEELSHIEDEENNEWLCNDLLADSLCVETEKTISPIHFDSKFNISLPKYPQITIKLDPLPKSLYLLFLSHPEGIFLKEIQNYEKELRCIYSVVSGRKNPTVINRMFNSLVDPTDNPLHKNISIIRRSFMSQLSYEIAQNYIPTHGRNTAHNIPLDDSLIEIPDEIFETSC